MKAFIVRIEQERGVDKQHKVRKMVVTADNKLAAEELARRYCDGYFQYITIRVLSNEELDDNSVMAVGDPD